MWLTYPLPVSTAFDAGKWTNLYLAIAGTSGVLLGLFLVAFTVRLQEIESSPVLRNRARSVSTFQVWLGAHTRCPDTPPDRVFSRYRAPAGVRHFLD